MVGISIGMMPDLALLEYELVLPFDLALHFAFAPAFRSMLPPDGFVVAAA